MVIQMGGISSITVTMGAVALDGSIAADVNALAQTLGPLPIVESLRSPL